MFEVDNNIAKINGMAGKYDGKVENPSVKYGRNAVENFYTYMENPIVNNKPVPAPILDFGVGEDVAEQNTKKIDNFIKENDAYLNALPPLQYEYRYMPELKNGQIDKQAVLASAYEEMGQNKELSVEELDYRFAPNNTYTSKALDTNYDGKIDIAEYGSSILAADMLSKSDIPDVNNVDGTINSQGFNAVLEYSAKSNSDAAAKLYSNIYNTYNLGEAQKEFKPE